MLEPVLFGTSDGVDEASPEISGIEVGRGDSRTRLDVVEKASAVLSALEVEKTMLEVALSCFDDTGGALTPKPAQDKLGFIMIFGRRLTNPILIKVEDSVHIFKENVSYYPFDVRRGIQSSSYIT